MPLNWAFIETLLEIWCGAAERFGDQPSLQNSKSMFRAFQTSLCAWAVAKVSGFNHNHLRRLIEVERLAKSEGITEEEADRELYRRERGVVSTEGPLPPHFRDEEF
ncbi:hypothetical protein FZ103_03490 [Streptomonospora sp. PA3]|uniref:hypothetical protein n=1 Tax=Streptomonospora sp. PA3 TaxID=2607326 RepID=UPI0012DF9E29|nr:hypothetical protein [Streptomonospora sp. PA3]MUL40250.1 hypothetical protein [Streptomonospora sp. PA3]